MTGVGVAVALLVTLSGAAWTARAATVAILPPPRPLAGSQPFATLLCKFAGVAVEPVSISYFDRLMLEGPESLDQYWRAMSSGRINVAGSQAFGWFAMPHPPRVYRNNEPDSAELEALARDCSAAADADVDFTRFTGINLVFNECLLRPRGGEMALTLDGVRRRFRVLWLCPGASAAHQIVAHEMGHSFGLTHSTDEDGDEYGNTWDVMSVAGYCAGESDFGVLTQEPIAFNKDLLGWIPPERKFRSPGREARTIVLDAADGGTGYLIAEVPLGRSRMYTVEARVRAGFDDALSTSGVLIHEVDFRRQNKARLVSPQSNRAGDVAGMFGGWSAGATFDDAVSGVSVRVDEALENGFIVTISQGTTPAQIVRSGGPVRLAPHASGQRSSASSPICGDETRN
jgi:hypothetical protein